MRRLLLPFSPLFGAGVVARNWLYDAGLLRSRSVGVPVISVGNLSAGGSGKTPLVELLARKLVHRGRKVAIVSRGYGRRTTGTKVVSNGSVQCAEASESGDEPAQMASKLSGVVVVVDELRARGAAYAVEKFGVQVIILDDGFQHRALRRDVDIVVIPAEETLRPGWLLPAGNRREPIGSLGRASLVAISRCESRSQLHEASESVRRWINKPVIGLSTRVSAFRRASTGFSLDVAGLRGKSAVAFSGIGSPQTFDKTLDSLGLLIRSHEVFADHHWYLDGELQNLEKFAMDNGVDFLVTTEKDIARLNSGEGEGKAFLERAPVFYVEIENDVLDGSRALDEIIDQVCRGSVT